MSGQGEEWKQPVEKDQKRTEPTDADSALCLTYYLFFSANPQRKSFAVAAVGMASLLDHLLLGSEARLVANLLQRLLYLLYCGLVGIIDYRDLLRLGRSLDVLHTLDEAKVLLHLVLTLSTLQFGIGSEDDRLDILGRNSHHREQHQQKSKKSLHNLILLDYLFYIFLFV